MYYILKIFKGLLISTFSISGPFIISFGTFSGLILFLEVFSGSKIPNESYFRIYTAYILFLWVVAIYNTSFFRESNESRKETQSSILGKENLLNLEYQRQRFLKNVLTGGIAIFVDWVMERNNVSIYDVFKRPSDWQDFDKNHQVYPIIRLTKNSISYEIRFPKSGAQKLLVRQTKPNEINYGEFHEESLWKWSFIFPLVPLKFIMQIF